jgi:ABC-type nitrate/sulfonate/bicarbonate transport system substrate-binding protein
MAAAGFLVASTARAQTAAQVEMEPVVIEVPGARNLQFLTLWVAFGAGYFHREGLAPRIAVAPGPRLTGQGLLKGEAQVALLPPPMFLGMIAEEKPIVLFASLLANEPINLVIRGDIAEARGVLGEQDLGKRLQAMKGLRVGLAEEVSPRLRVMAKSAKQDADRLFRLVVVPGPDQIEAFASGRVDALFAHTPYLETVLVDHNAVLVAENSKGAIAELSDGQIHALATTRTVIQEKPDLIRRVTRAIAGAQQLIHSDVQEAAEAVIASGAGSTADRRKIETIVAVYAPAVPRTPSVSIEGIKRDVALYPAHPRAPDFARVDPQRFVSASF